MQREEISALGKLNIMTISPTKIGKRGKEHKRGKETVKKRRRKRKRKKEKTKERK